MTSYVWPTDTNGGGTFVGPISSISGNFVSFADATGNLGADSGIPSSLTASTALVAGPSKAIASSSTTSTELGYVHGVTSAIQTQLNTKLPTTGVGLVQVIAGMLEIPTEKTYVLDQSAAYAYTINTLIIQTLSGTATVAINIAGTPVTGISAVSVSSTPATGTATAANVVSVGNQVTMVVSGATIPMDMSYTLKYTR